METGEMIRILREKNGWSQETLAEKVGYRDRSSIAKIEAGHVDLTQSKIVAFAAIFRVSPAQLMGLDETPAAEGTSVRLDPTATVYDIVADECGHQASELLQVYMTLDPKGRDTALITVKGFSMLEEKTQERTTSAQSA